MSCLRSSPRAHRALRWSDWALAYLVAWLAPLVLGIATIGLHYLVSNAIAGNGMPLLRMSSYFLATALTISPAFTWIGLIVSLPIVVVLMARGWFGWLPAMVAGALAGAIATGMLGGIGSAVGPSFGAGAALVFWLMLRHQRPELF